MADDDDSHTQSQECGTVREFSANGVSMSTSDVEAKLDQGNIEEAESSLREGCSLNFEVRFIVSFPKCQYLQFFFFFHDLKLDQFFLFCCFPKEARALLGKLEYQRGNVEGALRVLDGIDLQAAIQRLQPSVNDNSNPVYLFFFILLPLLLMTKTVLIVICSLQIRNTLPASFFQAFT